MSNLRCFKGSLSPKLAVMVTLCLLSFAPFAIAQTVNCTGVAAWSPNSVSYAVGNLVTYNGSEYKCIQANTSQAGWDPVDVPALWSLVGTCGTSSATPTPTATATTNPTVQPTVNPTATPNPTATATATSSGSGGASCWPAWSSTTAYNGGAQVSYSGENYQAAYWTQGNNPSTSSGPAGSGQPWIPEGACGGSGGGSTATPTATPVPPTPTPTPTSSGSGSGAAANFIFSPYKDITVDANWNTGIQQTTAGGTSEPVTQAMPNKSETWAFATGTCGSETWAGLSPALEASNVQAFVSAGKDYMISTGGAAGSFDCPSASGFASFINTYNSSNMLGVDFDIETGQTQATISDLVNAVKGVESQFPNMRFSFTVASFGTTAANPIFNSTGVMVMNTIQSAGLGGNWTINPMSFDFGSPTSSVCVVVNGACEMGQSAIATMQAINQQYGVSYGHIEVTLEVPTDDGGAPFTSSDVTTVCNWIKSNGVAGIHYWSLDRDTGFTYAKSIPSACGTN